MESFQQQREKPVKDVDEAASSEEDSDNESINMDTGEAEIESRLSITEAIQDTIVLMKEAKDRKVTMSIAHAAQIKTYAQQRNNDLSPTELKKLDKERDAKNKSYSIEIKKLEDAITGHKELLANLGYQEPATVKRSSAEEMDLVRSIETSLAVDKDLDNEDKRITMKPDTTDVKHAAIASFLKQDWIP
ncbi:hypothetical protein BGZ51_000555, partial [Haplosporangium sp. Z 767]